MQKKVVITLVLLSLLLLACEIPSFLLPREAQDTTSVQEIPTSNIVELVATPTPMPVPTLEFTPTKPPRPTRTPTYDARLIPGIATVKDAKLDTVALNPPVYIVNITGTLPSACHQVKVDIAKPNAQGEIIIKVSSTLDPGKMCAQGEQPFEISLKLDNLPNGEYNVIVNELNTGSFKYP